MILSFRKHECKKDMNFNVDLVQNISQLLSPLITEDELKYLKKLPRGPLSSKLSHQDTIVPNLLKNAEDEVLRLYHRQEYFRKAYNNTLKRMDTLANSLPSYALDYITTSGYHKDALNKEEEEEEEEEEEDIPLDPDYINFMMKTIQHRQNRDNIESNVYDIQSMLKAPPRKLNQSTDIQTIDSQIEMLEASLLHYYEFVSPCRDSPIWPVLPLKRSL